jgi:hypothetical protein
MSTLLRLKPKPENALFDEAEVRKTLSRIVKSGGVFEIRALDAKLSGNYRAGTISGYFDNLGACISELGNLTEAKGIYVTLNPVNPALLARCANRLAYAEKNATTNDQHILQRRWLLLDLDPDRPSGISAADNEKEAAHKKALQVYDYLKRRGWAPPLVADSGNGFHLLYPIDLLCPDDGLLGKVLAAIAGRFDGDGVKLDRSVHNPARIARLYGTLAAKGDNTRDRPHRLSTILKSPLRVEVTGEQLCALLDDLQPLEPAQPERAAARNDAFDVEGFLTRYGVEVAERTTESGGTIKWRLKHCPFNHDHVDGEAAVFQYPSGKLGFNCFHSSCSGKHWKDFRQHFEPERKLPPARVDLWASGDTDPVELPPPAPYVPPPLTLLPSELQQYVIAAAESLNVDVTFIFLPLLSSLATAIGNSRSILIKRGFIQPPVIWTAIVGPSGSRKSPAIEAGCLPGMEHERELVRQNKEADELYENELSQWESKKGQKRGPKPEKPAILTCTCDDLTIEVLADMLVTNPRGLLVAKDELSHWLASFDQYKNAKGSDVTRWLSLHTAVFLAVDRRTDDRHHRIFLPRVCITGGIQPAILRRVLTPEFFERGLPARFLFAFPPFRKDQWSEETIADDLRDHVLKLFEGLWLLQPEHDDHAEPQPKLLHLDADAKAVFVEFYNECGESAMESDEHGEYVWAKLTGYAARLALVGQLARDPEAEIITGEVMRAACDLARWFGAEAVRIYATFAETSAEREQRKLVDFIESRRAVTVRDVMQCYWPLKNKREEAEQALNDLVKKGLGKWEPVPTTAKGGKPTRVFQLLKASTSTKPSHLRAEAGGFVDVDVPSVPTNTVKGEALVL